MPHPGGGGNGGGGGHSGHMPGHGHGHPGHHPGHGMHHPHPGHPGHPGHNHYYNHKHFHNKKFGYGFVYKGKTYKHWCYNHNWYGWEYRRWYDTCGCYLYWAPVDSCWYQYDTTDQVFLPCDDFITEDAIPEDDDGGGQ